MYQNKMAVNFTKQISNVYEISLPIFSQKTSTNYKCADTCIANIKCIPPSSKYMNSFPSLNVTLYM